MHELAADHVPDGGQRSARNPAGGRLLRRTIDDERLERLEEMAGREFDLFGRCSLAQFLAQLCHKGIAARQLIVAKPAAFEPGEQPAARLRRQLPQVALDGLLRGLAHPPHRPARRFAPIAAPQPQDARYSLTL